MDTKTCNRCGEEKPLERFAKSKQIKSGYAPQCKDCDNKRKRESETRLKAADPEAWAKRQRAYTRKYKEKYPERVKESGRKQSLKSRFGITVEQYDTILESQGGHCATCEYVPETRSLAVDHDHSCCATVKTCGNCIRGLLCGNCNTALGLLKDNTETLEKMLTYLKR